MTKDSNGHTWTIDEDGVCEYDQGYVCPCGARKVVMAEGDSHPSLEALQPCPGGRSIVVRGHGPWCETNGCPLCNGILVREHPDADL